VSGPASDVARPGSNVQSKNLPSAGNPKRVLEGYVKNGVVHLLEGDLPDGTFVNVIPK
jgi:probable phosphoglycerate mutase